MTNRQQPDELPPHNQDAEEAVNGSLLINSACYSEIIGLIISNDFLSEANSKIFTACTSLYNKQVAIDIVTLAAELEMAGNLEKCGGNAYLNHLLAVVPTSLDIRYYAEIVHRLSIHRQLISAAYQIDQLGYEVVDDVTEPLDKADNLLLDIRKKAAYTPLITPKMRTDRALERYTKLANSEKGFAVKTGFPTLDNFLGGGFYNGEVIIMAGRPGIGKTTMLQTLANAQGVNNNVLFCSAEMPVDSLTDRDMSMIMGVHVHKVRFGHYDQEFYDSLIKSAGELAESKVYYLENKRGQALNTGRILSTALEMQLRYGLSAIYVDYLGLLDDSWGNNQNERLGYISRRLKAIALDIDVPVIIAHQMSRAVASREANIPQLSDLYESGHIEANADCVIFIHREDYYDRNSLNHKGQLIIAKERQGGTVGNVDIMFSKEKNTYVEVTERWGEPVYDE